MKEFSQRKVKIKKFKSVKLSDYASISPRSEKLFEFNDDWYTQTKINKKDTLYVDFSCTKIDKIAICKFNSSGIVITALDDGCSFNENKKARVLKLYQNCVTLPCLMNNLDTIKVLRFFCF